MMSTGASADQGLSASLDVPGNANDFKMQPLSAASGPARPPATAKKEKDQPPMMPDKAVSKTAQPLALSKGTPFWDWHSLLDGVAYSGQMDDSVPLLYKSVAKPSASAPVDQVLLASH